jgi:hypothetical protein
MSRAIRLELETHGGLRDVPDQILGDYIEITSAFVADMKDELARRKSEERTETDPQEVV